VDAQWSAQRTRTALDGAIALRKSSCPTCRRFCLQPCSTLKWKPYYVCVNFSPFPFSVQLKGFSNEVLSLCDLFCIFCEAANRLPETEFLCQLLSVFYWSHLDLSAMRLSGTGPIFNFVFPLHLIFSFRCFSCILSNSYLFISSTRFAFLCHPTVLARPPILLSSKPQHRH
jgi:hypothetical protein